MNINPSQPKEYERWFVRFGMIVIFIASFLLIYVIYLLLFPVKVLEIKTQPIQIVNKTLKPGDTLQFKFDYCKFKPIESRIALSFIDGEIIPILGSIKNFPTGCHSVKGEARVPDTLDPDRYRFSLSFTYRVNQLRSVTVTAMSESFLVTDKEGNMPSDSEDDLDSTLQFKQATLDTQTVQTEKERIEATPSQSTVNYNISGESAQTTQPTPVPTPPSAQSSPKPLINLEPVISPILKPLEPVIGL